MPIRASDSLGPPIPCGSGLHLLAVSIQRGRVPRARQLKLRQREKRVVRTLVSFLVPPSIRYALVPLSISSEIGACASLDHGVFRVGAIDPSGGVLSFPQVANGGTQLLLDSVFLYYLRIERHMMGRGWSHDAFEARKSSS